MRRRSLTWLSRNMPGVIIALGLTWEAWALADETQRFTFSAWLRRLFHTDTNAGKRTWRVAWRGFDFWFSTHIENFPEPKD